MEMYARAVALDPGFALAFAKLSEAHSNFYASTTAGRPEDSRGGQDGRGDRGPAPARSGGGSRRAGLLPLACRKAYDDALREFALADRLQPNSAEVIQAIGLFERRQGRMREAVVHLKRARELDPRSAELASDIGLTDWFLRAYPESEQISQPRHRAGAGLGRALRPEGLALRLLARRPGAAPAIVRRRGANARPGQPDRLHEPGGDVPGSAGPGDRAAFEQLAARDFEEDTALYALSKAEWYRLRGTPALVRLYSDSARAVLEVRAAVRARCCPGGAASWDTPMPDSAARRTRCARATRRSAWFRPRPRR